MEKDAICRIADKRRSSLFSQVYTDAGAEVRGGRGSVVKIKCAKENLREKRMNLARRASDGIQYEVVRFGQIETRCREDWCYLNRWEYERTRTTGGLQRESQK